MKNRNTVLLLGITSILILISVQVFIITGIWKQKNEMFALKYTILSKDALGYISRRLPTDGFDTVRFLLSKYSEKANKELHAIQDKKELAEKKKDILKYFTKVVNQEQDLSGLLSSFFESRGFEKKFTSNIVINNLEMISNDTIVVYRSEDFANMIAPEQNKKPATTESYKSQILVNWFRWEDNNYRIVFDYFIDFSDKQLVILKDCLLYTSDAADEEDSVDL